MIQSTTQTIEQLPASNKEPQVVNVKDENYVDRYLSDIRDALRMAYLALSTSNPMNMTFNQINDNIGRIIRKKVTIGEYWTLDRRSKLTVIIKKAYGDLRDRKNRIPTTIEVVGFVESQLTLPDFNDELENAPALIWVEEILQDENSWKLLGDFYSLQNFLNNSVSRLSLGVRNLLRSPKLSNQEFVILYNYFRGIPLLNGYFFENKYTGGRLKEDIDPLIEQL